MTRHGAVVVSEPTKCWASTSGGVIPSRSLGNNISIWRVWRAKPNNCQVRIAVGWTIERVPTPTNVDPPANSRIADDNRHQAIPTSG